MCAATSDDGDDEDVGNGNDGGDDDATVSLNLFLPPYPILILINSMGVFYTALRYFHCHF